MRLTDFWDRMGAAFGAGYADSLARDQVLTGLQGRTVHEALAQGERVQDVWRVVCEHFDLPAHAR